MSLARALACSFLLFASGVAVHIMSSPREDLYGDRLSENFGSSANI